MLIELCLKKLMVLSLGEYLCVILVIFPLV